jgi:16S rRNA (uracil1498-N3)-methyltransferase
MNLRLFATAKKLRSPAISLRKRRSFSHDAVTNRITHHAMHRFFLPPENCRGQSLRLDGREAHHALRVLRLERGDAVTVLDGAGNAFSCDVESTAKDLLTLSVRGKKTTAPLPCAITLLVAVPKGKIIEDIIEKAVELGAHRIVPLLTERVVTQLDRDGAEQKREKWQQVAIEAIKQCGATWLPEVTAPIALTEFLAHRNAGLHPGLSPDLRAGSETGAPATGEPFELSLVGSLQTERRHPREWIAEFQRQHSRLPRTAAVWIGPEGDFTLAELQAIEAAGARPVTLGALTLRVATAAIYCLSFLSYELNSAPRQ